MLLGTILNLGTAFYIKLMFVQIIITLGLINFKMYRMYSQQSLKSKPEKQHFVYHIVSHETSQQLQRRTSLLTMQADCTTFESDYQQIVSSIHLPSNFPMFYSAPEYNLTFCMTPKIASTFWTSVFALLNNLTNGKPVFNLPRASIHFFYEDLLHSPLQDVLLRDTGLSALMVRNPYTRLFSTYIDKIYLPALSWSPLGRKHFDKLIKYIEPNVLNSTQNLKLCDRIITFEQFLDYVTSSLSIPDKHWAPLTVMCRPCESKPDLVLKIEDFTNETKVLLSRAKIKPQHLQPINMILRKEKTSDLKSIMQSLFHMRASLAKNCLSDYEFAHRIWKVMKIQGYIHNSVDFRRTMLQDVPELNASKMTQLVHEAIKSKPMTSSQMRKQRQREMVRAYSQVSDHVIQKVQQAYYLDFKLFKYDMELPKLL